MQCCYIFTMKLTPIHNNQGEEVKAVWNLEFKEAPSAAMKFHLRLMNLSLLISPFAVSTIIFQLELVDLDVI